MTDSPPETHRPKRSRRFRLLTFLIAATIVLAGLLGSALYQAREERQASIEIGRLGGVVIHKSRFSVRCPDWIARLLAREVLYPVWKVEMARPDLTTGEWDALTKNLRSLPHLQVLNIVHADVTDEELALFSQLPRSTNVGLVNCPMITDAGLAHLEHFTTAQELWLIGTTVTDGGVARLQKAIPDCAIMVHPTDDIPHEKMTAHLRQRGDWQGP